MVEAIQQPQEEFPGHALPTAHEAGEAARLKIPKLNLVLLPVLPPLTPKSPVIGPLPKPQAFTGYTSQLEGKDLHSQIDFDDPFEPEAEVRPFLDLLSSLCAGGFPSLRRPPPSPAPLPHPLSLPINLPSPSVPLSFSVTFLLPNPTSFTF